MASGPRLVVATLVLVVCDVIGGFLAVVSGVSTWGEAWGFDTDFTVPLPAGLVQLLRPGWPRATCGLPSGSPRPSS